MEVHDFGGTDEARRDRVVEVMSEVLLPGTPEFLRRYPHQLSGGQQQRVGLAMAFACRPSVIVLDEPTTGLDVSTQAHVLGDRARPCPTHGVAALYVTHDLAVVANLADRVAVMYAGRIVEEGPTRDLRQRPPPYTRHLIAAAPDISGDQRDRRAPGPGPVARQAAGRAARSRFGASSPPTGATTPSRRGHRSRSSHTVRCYPRRRSRRPRRRSRIVRSRRLAADAALSSAHVKASYSRHEVVHDVELRCRSRRVRGAGRRVRIGQDHRVALDRRPASRVDRRDPARRQPLARSRARPPGGPATRDPVRLPEPVQLAQPAPTDRRLGGPAARASAASAGDARRLVGEMLERVSLTAALRRALSRSALRRRAAARRHRPGAGQSGRRCSSVTRSRRPSTCSSKRPSSSCSPTCSAISGWRCCSSPTTCRSCARWPSASP